jgi:ADP-ribose pyrophosphatase YjhB (NUDIX family)
MNDAVVALIKCDEKILVGKKIKSSKKQLAGMYHIPGEVKYDNESDHEALKRCAKEELGLEINVGAYVGKSSTPTGREARWYECSSNTYILRIGSDLEDAIWVSKTEALRLCAHNIKSWSMEVINYFKE